MSDSDSDCLSSAAVNNAFGFPDENTMVHVKGPHIDQTLSLNGTSNPFVEPWNQERQRLPYSQSQSSMMGSRLLSPTRSIQSSLRGFAQSSLIGRRVPSPTRSIQSSFRGYSQNSMMDSRLQSPTRSIKSLSQGFAQSSMIGRRLPSPARSVQSSFRGYSHRSRMGSRLPSPSRSIQSFSRGYGQSSMIGRRGPSPTHSIQSSLSRGFAQRSMIGRRGPSPTQSMCSNMSMADSIVEAVKSGKFNKHELRIISEAVDKKKKGRIRKRMAKRRYRRMFMKGSDGSDTSMSSDDNRSTRTGITAFKGNSSLGRMNGSIYTNSISGRTSDDARSIQTDVNELRKTIKEQTMFRDRTDHLKQDSFKNIFHLGPKKTNNATSNRTANLTVQNTLQKDRFQSNFLLPSQRFAQSKSVLAIPEECHEKQNRMQVKKHPPSCNDLQPVDGEQEDILSEETDPDNSILKHPEPHRKRNLDSPEDTICSENKKTKLSSPKTVTDKVTATSKPAINNNVEETSNDFVFAKPQMPVRKLSNIKKLEDVVEPQSKKVENHQTLPVYKPLSPIRKITQEQASIDEQSETMQTSTNEVSMRPSFIKRKLFTQTLDVTENKNSAESSPSVSPAKGYSELPKEKNKARKLVISQSCLSRDIPSDGNNLLDLIHKIVPRDRMNVTTNTTQKIEIHPQTTEATLKNPNGVKEKATDEWDITAILSNCKTNDDHSDTFTDEDIFVVREKKESKQSKQNKETTKKSTTTSENVCRKSPIKENKSDPKASSKYKAAKEKSEEPKKTVYDYAHAFWNCDSESEGPGAPTPQKKINEIAQIKRNATEKNTLVVKNIKSVLEVTASSNDSTVSLEDIGKNIQALTSNRSLRIKAAKALKEKKMNSPMPCRRVDLQQTICKALNNGGKSTKKQASSSVKSTPPKKQVHSKGNHIEKAHDKQKKKSPTKIKANVPVPNKDSTSTRSKPNTNKTIASMILLDKDESESPHLDFTKTIIRGRPRKLGNAVNATALSSQAASTSLQDERVLPSTSKRRRGRPRKLSTAANATMSSEPASTSPQDELVSPNTCKKSRGRPRKLSNTANATVSSELASTSLQDERVSPNTCKKRRGRPRKLSNTANATVSLEPASTSLQDQSVSSNTSKRVGRPRKVADTSNTAVSEQILSTKGTKLKAAKIAKKEKPSSTNILTRTRILETPKNSRTDQSSKLGAAINKTAENNTKFNQTKVTNPKDKKQDRQKTVKDMVQNAVKECKVPIAPFSVPDLNKLQPKNGTKKNNADSSKQVLKNANLNDYIFRRTRSSREKSFLSPVRRAKSSPAKSKCKDSLKLPKTTALTSKIVDNSLSSDKENTNNLSMYGKSRRIRKSALKCCEGESVNRDKSYDYLKANGTGLQKTNARSKPVEVRKPPSTSIRSLDIATATIGVLPRHCLTEDTCRNTTFIENDCLSPTRSIASSIISRGGRSKFLSVW